MAILYLPKQDETQYLTTSVNYNFDVKVFSATFTYYKGKKVTDSGRIMVLKPRFIFEKVKRGRCLLTRVFDNNMKLQCSIELSLTADEFLCSSIEAVGQETIKN